MAEILASLRGSHKRTAETAGCCYGPHHGNRPISALERPVSYLIVFLGGGVGAALRHGVNRLSLAYFGPGFPYGTMVVNVAGSLAMGVLAGLFLARGSSQEWRLFLATGVLGGFTTFSAFSLDAVALWQRGDSLAFAAYVAGSVALSIAGLFIGLALTRSLV